MTVSLLARALAQPGQLYNLSLQEWEVLIRQARSADMLGRVAGLAIRCSQWDQIPIGPRAHMQAAMTVVRAQHTEVHREVEAIRQALSSLKIPLILLKGAAYVTAQLPASLGRSMSDIDVLVPQSSLAEVEARLMLAGWHTTHHDPYDQRYYRQWMHELPPMVHVSRGTAVDVHHAILPLTAAFKPNSKLLLEWARDIPNKPGLWMLGPHDQILHAITHLLCNEETSHGLRDLSDIDLMLRAHAVGEPDFWATLLERATQLDLRPLLAHALDQASAILKTPIPDWVIVAAHQRAAEHSILHSTGRPVMRWMLRRGLDCLHPTARRPGTNLAQGLLYFRAHALRMPVPLLIRHLTIKALKRTFPPRVKPGGILKA